MNKGILCGDCNKKFSPLDSLLESQLSVLNGAIGVRADRADGPKPARGESTIGPVEFDHTGTPAFPVPHTAHEEPLADGRRLVMMEFGDEKQAQQWLAEQRAAGLNVRQLSRGPIERKFIVDPVAVSWSFGGVDAFREVGRIALNFLAHKWPDHARAPELRTFKDFVEGKRLPDVNEPRFVWYASADVPEIQSSPFAFGHQVLVVLESDRAYARVRFFSTFDLCVAFGNLTTTEPGAVIFDIDPLADQPPDDLRTSAPADLPRWVLPPVTDNVDGLQELLSKRVRALLVRVEERQWAASTEGLLASINAARALPQRERVRMLTNLLDPQLGRVLHLAHDVAKEYRRKDAADEMARVRADILDSMIARDDQASDGLSAQARASLALAVSGLACAISSELDAGPLTEERLRLWLSGGLGAHAVGSALLPLFVRRLVTARK